MRRFLALAALTLAASLASWSAQPAAVRTFVLTKGPVTALPGAAVTESGTRAESGSWAVAIGSKPAVLSSSAKIHVPLVLTNPTKGSKNAKLEVQFLDSSNRAKLAASPLMLPLDPGDTPVDLVVPDWMTAQAKGLGLTQIQAVIVRQGHAKAQDAAPIDYDLAATIQADYPSGSAPLVVGFSAVASGGDAPYSFQWDFGDRAPLESGASPSHDYLYSGSYTAILRVTDQMGGTVTETLPISASSTPFSAAATSTPASGQVPLAVAFDVAPAGGTGTYAYDWNFGDGSAHSSRQNPTHVYTTMGSYSATVAVTSQGQTITSSTSVSAYSPLSVSCAVTPRNGPAPLTAAFSATPSGGTGTYAYDWDFGDGGAHSNAQNPTHIYQNGGTYTAVVKVTSGGQQTTCTQVVNVSYPPIVISASATPASGPAPLAVAFTASATGGDGGYAYSWDFGDGSTTTAQSPSHVYASVGLYTARLTVVSSTGQTATWAQAISANSSGFSVAVTASPTEGAAPVTTAFTATPIGGTAPYSFVWSFGDGSTGTVQDPQHTYASTGAYAPTLTVTDGAGKQAFWAGAVNATFPALQLNAAASPVSGSAPLAVSCTASPSGGDGQYSYLWSFGDGNTSTAQNPAHTFTSVGLYTISLTVTSGDQAGSWSQVVQVNSTGIGVTVSTSPSVGSAPLIVNFVSNVSGGFNPVVYAWDFGDGNTSAVADPTHVYQDPGTYAPKLAVTDAYGRQAFWSGAVTVNFPPLTVTASASPSQGAAPLAVNFTAQGSGGNGSYAYSWDFGDGSLPSPNQTTGHTYTMVGLYTAVLTVTSGTQTATWSHAILVNSTGFSVEVTGTPSIQTAPLTASFTAAVTGGTPPYTYSWTFDDPSSGPSDTSTLASPTHTFNSPGTYSVLLNVVDADGRQGFGTFTVVVLTSSLTVTGTATPHQGPAGMTVNFTSSPSGGNPPYTYAWDFGDATGIDPTQNPSHVYAHVGIYTANLTVTDNQSHTATWSQSIIVDSEGMTVSVTASPSLGVYPLPVTFTATPSGGTAPYTYAWDFGDPASGPLNTSTSNPASHTYTTAGTFTAKLTVTDTNGEQAFWIGVVTVNTPQLLVTCSATPAPPALPGPPEVYVAQNVAFSAVASGGDGTYVYTWAFGDGSSATGASATHAYSAAGVYTATVTVKSAGQTSVCSDTILVNDQNLQVTGTANPRLLVSPPQTVAFTSTPTGGNGSYVYLWDFGDGFTDTTQNPNHTYNSTGLFTVNLTVTSGVQRAYWTSTIYVGDPQLTVTATSAPSNGNAPLSVLFNTTVAGGTPPYSYMWDTGDGAPSSSASAFSHSYAAPGTYNWYVKVTDAALPTPHIAFAYGSVNVDYPLLQVDCSAAPTLVPGATDLTYQFGAAVTGGNGTYIYSWDFGDGTSGTGANPIHTYEVCNNPGSFNPTVTVTSGDQTVVCNMSPLIMPTPLPMTVTLSASPQVAHDGGTGIALVTLTANVCGGTPPYTYWFDVDPPFGSAGPNPTNTLSNWYFVGTHNPTVTVTDSSAPTPQQIIAGTTLEVVSP